ncbi:Crp/Fnr family transcriptional regulator [Pedobacter caeni]|uniref:cAMP-binding domain of CRP or a regulatory subunit of cAMP-dependent protein kinases n=1 Tax=Pedobacter caeni TaxID=288992 RepID=A0A1M4WI11_9SPHI|nr:Crp/Fnr family transcriptional regulator [Pedobacter caeni]SHE80693.1 cAMP-binding domain of CRP or a regulatory subunit of cAMP-dependent protein kinases [Pedobacter caeni]
MHELILKNISKHINLTPEEEAHFVGFLKQKQVSKKDFILKEGQICKEINFVESGTLRAFYLDKTGKESTIMFAVADWWVTDMFCFVNEQAAMLNIEAIEDSCILQLQKEDLDRLYLSVPKFERFFRIIMQNAYIREQLRVIQELSLSAEERYHNFLIKYPKVAQQVKQKQIASYLGITPEFLSMIRGNKGKKKIIS